MPATMFSPRLELFPTSPTSVLDSSIDRPQTAGYGKYGSHDEPHESRRMRRATIESMSSVTSYGSHRSLLRRTLLLVTSNIPSSKPYSVIATPGLLTPCTSASSLASSSLESPTASIPPNRRPVEKAPPRPRPISSSSQKFTRGISLAAGPTTALTPTTTNSLAQFSPTPHATSTLRQFGVPASSSRVQKALNVAIGHNDSSHRHVPGSETSRRRSRDLTRRASAHQNDDDFVFPPKKATSPTGWLLYPAGNLPSIARTLQPDSSKPSATATTGSSSGGLNASGGAWNIRVVTSGQEIAATPRPAFPIESKAQPQWPQQNKDTAQPVRVDKGKGKATAPAKAAHLQRFALQRSSSAPAPAIAENTSRVLPTTSTMEREKKFGSDLPSLAAIESGSKMMRSKIVCATCNEAGPDFPRCGRCGEAWCSRVCRVEANKESGGKHRCSPSVA